MWDGGSGNGGHGATSSQSMAKTLPPMMQVMQDIGGVELPAMFGKLVNENGAAPETIAIPRIVSDAPVEAVETASAD